MIAYGSPENEIKARDLQDRQRREVLEGIRREDADFVVSQISVLMEKWFELMTEKRR